MVGRREEMLQLGACGSESKLIFCFRKAGSHSSNTDRTIADKLKIPIVLICIQTGTTDCHCPRILRTCRGSSAVLAISPPVVLGLIIAVFLPVIA